MDAFIGVDVGTGSARAGVFDAEGHLLGAGAEAIATWRPRHEYYEQSSENIWTQVSRALREAVASARVDPRDVRGIGFDATCSLVALDTHDRPVTVSPTGSDEQNVVLWMDHRAEADADAITATSHPVLKYVGGVMSPEMQTPKLRWIKRHLPDSWRRTARFFDLPDFLVYRATGVDVRSACSTVCKWTYLEHEGGWQDSYFAAIGLPELASEGYQRIGSRIARPGERAGEGLSGAAAGELGLRSGTPVGVSLIDAHAGGLGVIGAPIEGSRDSQDLARRLVIVSGTSSCHMAVSEHPVFVPGVWGPYDSAMIPGMWLSEGGQSASGALVDHVLRSHAASAELLALAGRSGSTPYEVMNQQLTRLAGGSDVALLAHDMHVLPDFHGNRSPKADASLRGMMSGLSLAEDLDGLAVLYLATVQAIALGTRHIVEAMNERGHQIDTLFMCGGGARNPLMVRAHADATGLPVVLAREEEAVLLGAAILGASASGLLGDLSSAMARMSGAGEVIQPAGGRIGSYFDAKYRVYLRQHDDFLAYRSIMRAASRP